MLRNAFTWRLKYGKQLAWKGYWKLKSLLDFSSTEKPERIAIVVVGRNDNYGGDFSLRLRTTLDWNMAHLPGAELIYVEWNPLSSRPSDTEWIASRYAGAKCYIVPPEIHRDISANPDKLPVMEYFGKNLGIRKSAGDWILLTNADVAISPDTLRNMKKLNRNTVYGTHYVSIRWDHEPLSERHFRDKKIISVAFSVSHNIYNVSGNFVLTHRDNWMRATGYDESLTNSRAGVDSNGAAQLVYNGLRQQVLGHHLHLDHPESMVNTAHESHGDMSRLRGGSNIPYRNPGSWGLENYPLVKIADRIWALQKTSS